MKDLKITQGEAKVLGLSIDINDKKLVILHSDFYEADTEEMKSNLSLYADAHNTYQSTGMTASELAAQWKIVNDLAIEKARERNELEKQRNELLEALKAIAECEDTVETYELAKAAIQSVEQNEKQK